MCSRKLDNQEKIRKFTWKNFHGLREYGVFENLKTMIRKISLNSHRKISFVYDTFFDNIFVGKCPHLVIYDVFQLENRKNRIFPNKGNILRKRNLTSLQLAYLRGFKTIIRKNEIRKIQEIVKFNSQTPLDCFRFILGILNFQNFLGGSAPGSLK